MKVIDVSIKKAYTCKTCNQEIYYGKITDDDGNLYTIDGQMPNGKWGKDSNVITGAVDALVKDRLHKCSKHFVDNAVQKAPAPPMAGGVKLQEAETQKERKSFIPEYVSENERVIWNDIVGKTTEFVILAQQKLDEYPEIDNPALKGLISKTSFMVLSAMKAEQRNA